MRAAVLTGFGNPLEILERDAPRPGAGEALLRVRAVGLCGSDLKLVAGATPGTVLPLIPGHEVAGEVVGGDHPWRVGQRAACYLYESCGSCRWCRADQEVLCPSSRRIGRSRDGGLADYLAVRTSALLPFPEGLDFGAAAVAMDAVTTPWHALIFRARLRRGESVAVVGVGGLGLHAVQVAALAGARVVALDPVPERREEALHRGAHRALGVEGGLEVLEWSQGGVDVALEASGTTAGFRVALECVRKGGRIACCGYHPATDLQLNSARLALDELTLLGCRAGRRKDAEAALKAVAKGDVRPVVGVDLPLEEVNRGLDLLHTRTVVGRAVIRL